MLLASLLLHAPVPNPVGVRMGGYQQLVRAEIMRGRHRNSHEKPEAFVPGQPTRVAFTLNDAFHTFRKGHRVMVQVQSSWFPLVDRDRRPSWRSRRRSCRITARRPTRSTRAGRAGPRSCCRCCRSRGGSSPK